MFGLTDSAVEVVPVSALVAPKVDTPKKMSAVERALAADLALPANCWHIDTKTGVLTERIALSLDKGSDALRPKQPHIIVGTAFVERDPMHDQWGVNLYGNVFHPDGHGGATVRRATTNYVRPNSGKPFYTLRKPTRDDVDTALLFVRLALPDGMVLRTGGHTLMVSYGFSGDTKPIAVSKGEYLFAIKDRQRLNLLFGDGRVCSFVGQGATLKELRLSFMDMAKIRVEDAFLRLERTIGIENADDRKKAEYRVLASIADLLHLTKVDGVADQEIRLYILKEFFLKVNAGHLSAIHQRLTAIICAVDKLLLPVIRGEIVTPASEPVSISAEVVEESAPPVSAIEAAPVDAPSKAKRVPAKKLATAKRTARSLADLGALVEKRADDGAKPPKRAAVAKKAAAQK